MKELEDELAGKGYAELQSGLIEALNAFNSPYLVPRAALGTTVSSYQLNSQTGYPPRVVQLVFRLNF